VRASLASLLGFDDPLLVSQTTQVAAIRDHRQPLRQKIVPGIAGTNLDYFSNDPEARNILT